MTIHSKVRDVADVDQPWLRTLVASTWGLPVVTWGRAYADPERLDGVLAEVDGEPVGAVTFHVDGDEWEVVRVAARCSSWRQRLLICVEHFARADHP